MGGKRNMVGKKDEVKEGKWWAGKEKKEKKASLKKKRKRKQI